MNMYDFINQAYRPGFELYFDDVAKDDFDMNMTEFILSTSHQQNDFIVRSIDWLNVFNIIKYIFMVMIVVEGYSNK